MGLARLAPVSTYKVLSGRVRGWALSISKLKLRFQAYPYSTIPLALLKTLFSVHNFPEILCAAHVLEESHEASDGVEFLTRTRSDWESSAFGNHITWHLALHYFGMFALGPLYCCYVFRMFRLGKY